MKKEKSKVYFADFSAKPGFNLLQKLKRLLIQSGIKNIDFDQKFVAVKIHFGEPGNLAYLRPNYAKVVCDLIKELGGRPFLTDCNTLYVGKRKNALDHLDAAYENGFSPFSTGCHVIIADGLKGTDEKRVPIHLDYIKEAKIGRAIMDADIFISLTHFKGHESTGFGGAIKNIGMGCGSRAGKMEMHSSGKPFNHIEKCVGCGRCIGVCNFDAIKSPNDESNDILNRKMAEYTYAVIKDKPNFHISLITDVSPNCDCHSENDIPIVPNIGMLASFDPVALDVACADLVNKQEPIKHSLLAKNISKQSNIETKDHFSLAHPDTNWESAIEHAVKIGIGSNDYDLISI